MLDRSTVVDAHGKHQVGDQLGLVEFLIPSEVSNIEGLIPSEFGKIFQSLRPIQNLVPVGV